jgi:hypothetical protein
MNGLAYRQCLFGMAVLTDTGPRNADGILSRDRRNGTGEQIEQEACKENQGKAF